MRESVEERGKKVKRESQEKTQDKTLLGHSERGLNEDFGEKFRNPPNRAPCGEMWGNMGESVYERGSMEERLGMARRG